jgi:predicted nucleotidyltransferase
MAKIPRSPDEIFSDFVADLKEVFLDDLVSVILFGSGAGDDYVFKKSDLNFLVVLSEKGIEKLDKGFDLVKKWGRRRVSPPLYVTEEYVRSSLDSFPIEFLNMQRRHILVHGKDVLKKLKVDRDNLRLECEAQVKGKLLHLREEFLKTLGRKKPLQNLVSMTVPTFASIFTALLIFKDIEPPAGKEEILLKTAETFELNRDVFQRVMEVREKRRTLSRNELIELMRNYISEIRRLTKIVDGWTVTQ